MDKEYILEKINSSDYKPMNFAEMVDKWDISNEDKPIFETVLESLIASGLVYTTKKGRFISIKDKGIMLGKISTNEKGFGFFQETATKAEFFIPHNSLKDAQNNDIVLAKLVAKTGGKNKEAKVERIISRGTKSFVGEATFYKGEITIIPIDNKIFGKYRAQSVELSKGARVFCKIVSYPDNNNFGLVDIIGFASDLDEADMAIEEVMIKYNLPKEFPKEVLEAATNAAHEVSSDEITSRRDLRDLLMVTIDGEDARDFDDAVSIEKTESGYRLGVHIADVSHYVSVKDTIDQEAYKRATSIYFPDRVLPMLPVDLSNGICSLQQDKDRLAMTAMMEIDGKGKVVSYEIFPSVIKVNSRMTYTKVTKILKRNQADTNIEEIKEYSDLFSFFDLMADLADILTKMRASRGAIFFDFPELKIFVDEKGKAIELAKRVRNQAESIIEEFMLLANETVAEHLFWLTAPCIYRVHEEPPLEGINNFNTVAAPFGFKLKLDSNGKIYSKQYQEVIEKLENHPMKDMLMNLLLRSMSHARYDIKPIGHFGLWVVYYCHFTSPIRRYPDLEVHRILKRYMKDNLPSENEKSKINLKAYQSAVQSSEREIIAESAEREVDKIKSVEYMKSFVGEIFKGKVSGMINSGLFIELENLTEGFLPFNSLKGYHTFFEKEMVVRDGGNKVRFKIGDQIQVKLVKADILLGHLDFNLEEGDTVD
ncbi:MAG: ribonuclease R [Firmicutes bacterium]|nr:ribonuclease R [Bacillota bacterium]